MSPSASGAEGERVTLRPVGADDWRDVAKLEVTEEQRAFVAEPSYYLALCAFGGTWQPLAIYLGERVIGFMMWAVDPEDESCWLGGVFIDRRHQRRGHGRRAILTAIEMLAREGGHRRFALSYHPDNAAKALYARLGFDETGEWAEDEAVARLTLDDDGES